MTSPANRGKTAEAQFQKALDDYAKTDYTFDYERIYDARSSMGKMSNPRAGDFVIYHRGLNILIELKQVAHDYRLPVANFKPDQRARMRKRELAGTLCAVVIYHSTTDVWRMERLEYFKGSAVGSWDMRDVLTTDLSNIMQVLTLEAKETLCPSPPQMT